MKKINIILGLIIVYSIACCAPKNKQEGLNISRITYMFDDKINSHIKEKVYYLIKNCSAQKKYFGVKINVCDIEKGNYEISVHYFENHPNKEHFLNTNRFLVIENNFELPVISSDIVFTKDIKPNSNYKWNRIDGYGCIEIITFNQKNEILKITKCGNDL
jgi:hypothetical protein